jgi:phage tail sheath protein FI
MAALNNDRANTGFVIGDTPMTLPATMSSITTYNASITSSDPYVGLFYPSALTTDLTGNEIAVPPSHMMLRTFLHSDNESYQWFAPAGTLRGGVDNATAVGYLKDGEFQQSPIPESLRNVLQDVKINPIATLPGAGLVVFGQKTRAKNASSLDRVNVSRLVAYLRRQLDLLARPFLFEPNDRITRNEIKQTAESLMLELVGQRALYDFIVVCDESNNTPSRIDRNELYLDIAIEPVKAVEFIYIPLRIKNTGEIAALG